MKKIFNCLISASFIPLGLLPINAFADEAAACTSVKTTIKHVLEWRISARTFFADGQVSRRDFPNNIAFRSEGDGIEKVILLFRRDGSVTNASSCKDGVLRIVFENGQMPVILAMWDRAKNSNNATTFFCAFSNTEASVTGRCNLEGNIN